MKTLRTLLVLSIGYAAGVAAPAIAGGLETTLSPSWSKTSPANFGAILNADKRPDHVSKLVTVAVDASKPKRTTYTIKYGDAACTVLADDGAAIGLAFAPGPTVEDIYSIATVAGASLETMQVTRFKDTRVPSMPAGVAR
jgi:hypothetical protein